MRLTHFFGLLLTLSACTPTIDNRGFDFELARAEDVRVGQTKDEVITLVGSPSATSSFKDQAWYYISRRLSTQSFFEPEVKEQKVFVIYFDAQDRVSTTEHLNKDQMVSVAPNKNKTETSGYESGILRDVFGNFGKFAGKTPTKS